MFDKANERRLEKRLRYHWPVWFAEDFNETLSQGQMVDVSSRGAAFTCYADKSGQYLGRQVTTRFSVPKFSDGGCFDMASFTRVGYICRIDDVNKFLRRVAVQFTEPLSFKPGEQTDSESGCQQELDAVVFWRYAAFRPL